MSHRLFRHLARFLVVSAFVSSGAFASDTLQCLVFKPLPVASDGRLDGTVVNACAKAVTAYKFELKILYSDGTSAAVRGLGADFLPGMAFASPGSGIGALLPGEERTRYMTTVQAWQMQKPISGTEITTQCIVFDDATALGDEQELTFLFRDRRDSLRELTFWHQSFARYKGQLAAQGRLASLIDLSNVRTRQRTMSPPYSPQLVETQANAMQATLDGLDKALESGTMSRAEAVQWLERYVSTLESNYEKHSERRK